MNIVDEGKALAGNYKFINKDVICSVRVKD